MIPSAKMFNPVDIASSKTQIDTSWLIPTDTPVNLLINEFKPVRFLFVVFLDSNVVIDYGDWMFLIQ